GPGQEAEQRGARERAARSEGAIGHLLAGRVQPLVRADEHPAGDDGQPWVGVEEIGRSLQGAGLPPGVIVAEGNVGPVAELDADVAAGRAEVLGQADAADSREAPPQRRSEEHTSELQSLAYLVCRLLLE